MVGVSLLLSRHLSRLRYHRLFSTSDTDVILNSLTGLGGISVKVVDATDIVKQATTKHGCSPVASVALGRALVGNLLLAHGSDEEETYQIQVLGKGTLGSISTEVVTRNKVQYCRGFVGNPSAVAVIGSNGLVDVSAAVGKGELHVHRSHPSWKDPFIGTTALATSEIGEDLVQYLFDSQQIRSALWLGVFLEQPSTGRPPGVCSAKGYLCTVLPGCSEEEISALEKNIHRFSAAALASEFISADQILNELTAGMEEQFRERGAMELSCTCSQSKAVGSLAVLGQDEVEKIIRGTESVNVVCHWCNEARDITPQELSDHMSSLSKGERDTKV